MRLSWFISRVTSPVFVGIMYFIVITPMGILMRKLGLSQVSSSEDRVGSGLPVMIAVVVTSGGNSEIQRRCRCAT